MEGGGGYIQLGEYLRNAAVGWEDEGEVPIAFHVL